MSDRDPQSSGNALDWAGTPERSDWLVQELRRRARRRQRRRAVGAAGALLLAGVAWTWWSAGPGAGPAARAAVVRQPERESLPDGSIVQRRDGARLVVDFSGKSRRVTLLGGEAHFVVAKDPARPFVVSARGVTAQAVGTEFAMRLEASEVCVLVTEGRVALDPADKEGVDRGPVVLLEAGKQAVVPRPPAAVGAPVAPPRVTTLAPAEIAEQLAWRVPRLEFSGTRLRDAVELFNRYNPRRLALAEGALGDLQISGVVRADNPEALLQLLESNYPLVARDAGAAGIVLERRR